MLDLAISIDCHSNGISVVETNHGREFRAPEWPQDSDFQLVAFNQSAKICKIVWPEELVSDIAAALEALNRTGNMSGRKPDWYRRLKLYSSRESLLV